MSANFLIFDTVTIRENIKIALESIKTNKLRTTITCLIISFGIMALVGILTATDAIESSISEKFSSLGANSFNIRNRAANIHFGRQGRRNNQTYPSITYNEAMAFKEQYVFPATVAISVNAAFASTAKYESSKTNPNTNVIGVDENYLLVSGYQLKEGRNFSVTDVEEGRAVALIGAELETKLFKGTRAVGKDFTVGGVSYTVAGVLSPKGASMGMGGDRIVLVPLSNVRSEFSRPNMSFTITVAVSNMNSMDYAIDEATGLLRSIRRLKVSDANNFEITKSDSLANSLIDNLKYVTIAATLIGLITLIGAAIGLMNIMLVSVTERTREIGTRKALGATSAAIRQQFLVEALVIGQLGGLGGIILGIVIGNIVSAIVGGGFIIPWIWMISGALLCFIVGLISGLYPAGKAARLDPVEALRFE